MLRPPTIDRTLDTMGLKGLLIGTVPKSLVRVFAGRYIAGDTAADAIATADRLHAQRGLCSTVDLLGEAIAERAQAEAEVALYRELLDAIDGRAHVSVSVKLSALGQGIDDAWCLENLLALTEQARERGTRLTVDMEDQKTVDSTLSIYRKLREAIDDDDDRDPDHVGIVLQSRLFRTPADIDALAPLKPRTRICIGIYNEPREVAMTDKRQMKERLLEQARAMMEAGWYTEVATHDEEFVRRALEIAKELGVAKDRVEFQFLLGVPRAELHRQLIDDGYIVRLYVPFGEHWYPYSMRRLEGNPGMAWQVLKNLMRR